MLKLLYIYFVIADYFPYNISADYFTMSSSANVLLCVKKKNGEKKRESRVLETKNARYAK